MLQLISHDFSLIFIEHRGSLKNILGQLILLFVDIFIIAFKSHQVVFYPKLFVDMIQKFLLNIIKVSLYINHIGVLFGSNRLVDDLV